MLSILELSYCLESKMISKFQVCFRNTTMMMKNYWATSSKSLKTPRYQIEITDNKRAKNKLEIENMRKRERPCHHCFYEVSESELGRRVTGFLIKLCVA